MYRRPNNIKVFEPKNPEYALCSSLTSEFIEAQSPYTIWWSVDSTKSEASQDELDKIYGEKSSGDRLIKFKKPNRIYLSLEINPIMVELTRLGVEQIEEITAVINIDDFRNRNFEDPKPGDVFRISYVVSEQQYRNVFYTVSTLVPFDIFNTKYINWHLYAEQTPMNEVPDSIKNYMELL